MSGSLKLLYIACFCCVTVLACTYDSSQETNNKLVSMLTNNGTPGLCLEPGNTDSEGELTLYRCGGRMAQFIWRENYTTAEHCLTLQFEKSKTVLDVENGNYADGTPVLHWHYIQFAYNQFWSILPVKNGFARIQNDLTKKYLTVNPGSTSGSYSIIQMDFNAQNPYQLWKFIA